MDPLFSQIAALGMALLLCTAALHKATRNVRFRQVLRDYRVVPVSTVHLFAVFVPAVEFFLAVCWLLHIELALAAIATIGLLASYTLAIAVNLLRGRVFIDCGCGFGRSKGGQPISTTLLFRNGLLMSIAALPLMPVTARVLHATDYVVAAAVLVLSLLLFSASTQLIRNRAAIRNWRGN